jgi:hypothetical protein
VKGEAFSDGGPISLFERLDRFGRKRRGALRFGRSHSLIGVQERCAQGLGPGLLVEFANRLKLAQEMGVAEGVIDVFEAQVGAPWSWTTTPPSSSGMAERGSSAR